MAGQITLLIALAVLTETIIDVVKSRVPVPGNVAAYLWPCSAMAVGIALAFWAQVGVSPLIPGITPATVWLDRVLAGLLIGGGASTIYDWLDRAKAEG